MVSEVVSPGAVPEPSSTVAGSSSSTKPFTNKSISIRLDETNYLLWRQQVLFAIDSLALGSHIDSAAVVPSQYLVANGVRTLNPEFLAFKQEDSALCSWLLSSISSSILSSLVNCRTALEIWDKSMRDYLAQIQSICETLSSWNWGNRNNAVYSSIVDVKSTPPIQWLLDLNI
ncbi:hypothetical protein GQ457_06G000280 [Hibiscus cannabinus]